MKKQMTLFMGCLATAAADDDFVALVAVGDMLLPKLMKGVVNL